MFAIKFKAAAFILTYLMPNGEGLTQSRDEAMKFSTHAAAKAYIEERGLDLHPAYAGIG